MARLLTKNGISPEEFCAHLTAAIYTSALKRGLKLPFHEVELAICDAIRKVMKSDMWVGQKCGDLPVCDQIKKEELWPKD